MLWRRGLHDHAGRVRDRLDAEVHLLVEARLHAVREREPLVRLGEMRVGLQPLRCWLLLAVGRRFTVWGLRLKDGAARVDGRVAAVQCTRAW